MFHLGTSTLTQLLATYGYLAVLLFVAIESTGIPFPGETMLLVAAIAAGTSHQLSIALVIVAAASGAILGFWVGRDGGYRLLRRYEERLEDEAERALPGPLDVSFRRG
jgi:membrane protein DedA with SNARE-associated domain